MRVRSSEERMGKRLVVRQGKGSQLTAFAEQTMKRYKRLQMLVERESDEIYSDLMSDGLVKK